MIRVSMGEPGVIERFVDRLVGVAVLDVLADDGDRHFVLRIADALHQLLPVVDVELAGLEPQLLDDQLVELVLGQAERHFVDRELLVDLFDDGLLLDVAEQGDLLAFVAADRALACGTMRMSG